MIELEAALQSTTSTQWLLHIPNNLDTLLLDHAWCEKRAAAFALRLIQSYPQHTFLLKPCARLAREELRHFELVMELLGELNITYRSLSIASYGKKLHQWVRSDEPGRFVDLCLIAALIEARSCERFHAMIPHLPTKKLQTFYHKLYLAEKRHFTVYLDFACNVMDSNTVLKRLDYLGEKEALILAQSEKIFRVHSGIPS